MRVVKIVFGHIGLLILIDGCIFPFDPDIEGSRDILVISGKVTDREGFQYIEISRSKPVYDPGGKAFQVSNCLVEIRDDLGNVFPGLEQEPGFYACRMDQEYLMPGTRYQLFVTTPEGKHYSSDFAELLPCAPIDSISFEISKMPTTNPEVFYQGVQFFVSTDGSDEFADNYRWDLVETWEYHSTYPIQDYYNGRINSPEEISYELFTCWETLHIPEIFTFSTRNQSSGIIRNFPLIYVSDQSARLSYKYSLLVSQLSLSEAAYEYWKILEEQSKQTGELYETQPSSIRGNIYCLENPAEFVLGFFYATSIIEERVFVKPNILTSELYCVPWGSVDPEFVLSVYLAEASRTQYPIYLVRIEDGTGAYRLDMADQQCFDCRMRGGTIQAPDFWE